MPINATLLGINEIQKIPNITDMQFTDVVIQVYPLRAQMQQLTNFCNAYLNLGEDPRRVKGRPFFKPMAPWVMMIVCNYGKMSTSNFGWFSQHELGFSMPVESYALDDSGRPVVSDWGLTYPFVYVDNPLSMQGGRQVYGWSKAGILLNDLAPNLEPNSPHCLMSISYTPDDATVNSANPHYQPIAEKFLQILQQRPFVSGPSGMQSALMSIPRAIAGSLSAALGMIDTIGALGTDNLTPDVLSLQALLPRLFSFSGNLMSTLYGGDSRSRNALNQTSGALGSAGMITLKQFRDAQKPAYACFQAIVRSKMSVDRMIDGGFLFDMWSGDTTGGIEVHLLRSRTQPIVEQLGIVSSGETNIDGATFDILRPVLPFWSKLDLTYGAIDYQYWRAIQLDFSQQGQATDWSSESPAQENANTAIQPPTPLAVVSEVKLQTDTLGHPTSTAQPDPGIAYCAMGSGASLELDGLFRYNDATIRVFPLLANSETLQATMTDYLENPDFGFKVLPAPEHPGSSYVCALIVNFGSMDLLDDSLNVPDDQKRVKGKYGGDRMVRFVVPGELYDKIKDPQGQNPDQAAVPFLSFAGEYWNYITEWEVYGRMVYKSFLDSPPSTWMLFPPTLENKAGLARASVDNTLAKMELTQGLLDTLTFLIPEYNEDKPAQQMSAIRVNSPGIPTATVEDSVGLEEALKKLGLFLYAKPFWYLSMKTVRDARFINDADYQALVGVLTNYQINLAQWGRLSDALLHIYNRPGLPLINLLGLQNGVLDGDYTSFAPIEPFYFGGTMSESLKGNLTTMIKGSWNRNPTLARAISS